MTSTELGYLSGVTSNIQDQLNGKALSGHDHTVIMDANHIDNYKLGISWSSSVSNPDWLCCFDSVLDGYDKSYSAVIRAISPTDMRNKINAAYIDHSHSILLDFTNPVNYKGAFDWGAPEDTWPTWIATYTNPEDGICKVRAIKPEILLKRLISDHYGSSLPSSGDSGQIFFLKST